MREKMFDTSKELHERLRKKRTRGTGEVGVKRKGMESNREKIEER